MKLIFGDAWEINERGETFLREVTKKALIEAGATLPCVVTELRLTWMPDDGPHKEVTVFKFGKDVFVANEGSPSWVEEAIKQYST